MKLRTVSFFAGCVLLLSACGNHQPPAPATDITPKADTTNEKFFPIASYLQSEIRYVDSTPLAILKRETVNNRTDSAFLTPAAFHALASSFLVPELDETNLEKNYTESSFGDKTTGYLSFTYAPKDKEHAALRRVDVVVAAGEGFDKVKSIYLERATRASDTLVMKKMYWQARHSFLVITSLQLPGKTAEVRQLKVVWNNEEGD
jgi:hypothetical protein